MRVLDLDMDYFMTEIANTPFSCKERLAEEDYGNLVWSAEEVRQFLEHNLGLSKTHKIPGKIVSGHNEALFFWEELINGKKPLTKRFAGQFLQRCDCVLTWLKCVIDIDFCTPK